MISTNYIGKTGTILTGEYRGFTIRIDDDRSNTGGILILIFKPGSNHGFDSWVETEKAIEQYLYESEWKIDWNENTSSPDNA